ncbi:helix-turn-helix transcriptional regulator [Aeromonas sp. 96A]|uniref:helix-turn-helix transcriptional regulator n=1 Tax=Aeromonas sp. 96A TaxID=3452730 RepID=UPI003F78C88D
MSDSVFIERKRLTILIGCRHDTIDRMVERGELPRPIRLGRNGRHRFIRAEIEPALKLHGSIWRNWKPPMLEVLSDHANHHDT